MDVAVVGATVAVTLSVTGAILGGLAAVGQRKNDSTTLLFNTLQSHMGTLSGENEDMRSRITEMERTISSLRDEVRNCEQGKELLQVELHQLRKQVNGGES